MFDPAAKDLTLEETQVIAKIAKLMNLASKNPNEHEAAAAMEKAQELMTKYNLEAATINGQQGKDAKREKSQIDGGFFNYQRRMWHAVADLNFCIHWIQEYYGEAFRYVDLYSGAKSMQAGEGKERQKVRVVKNRHVLIGRTLNTRQTIVMCEYLQQAIERLLKTAMTEDGIDISGNYANSFRNGVVASVLDKVHARRREHLMKERAKQQQAAQAAGRGDGTSITLSNYIDAETDANMDFVHGEGWSAKQAADRARVQEEMRKAAEEYQKWAEEHPEEAAQKEKEAKEEAQKQFRSGRRGKKDNTNWAAYSRGAKAGKDISLDPQVGGKMAGALR